MCLFEQDTSKSKLKWKKGARFSLQHRGSAIFSFQLPFKWNNESPPLKYETANGDGKEDEGDLLRFTAVNKGAFVC